MNGDITNEQAAILQDLCFDVDQVKEEVDNHVNQDQNDAFRSPEDVIVSYIDAGRLTEKQAEQLRLKYDVYSDQDEATIKSYMNMFPNLTKEEAIVQLGDKIGAPVITSATEFEYDVLLQDEQIKDISEMICNLIMDPWQTEYMQTAVYDILTEQDLASKDVLKIINNIDDYLQKYANSDFLGSFNIFNAFSQEPTVNAVYEMYVEAAVKEFTRGNTDAVNMMCSALYSSTAGLEGKTNVNFVEIFFENAPEEMVYEVAQQYPTLYPSHKLSDDMKNEKYDLSEFVEIVDWMD